MIEHRNINVGHISQCSKCRVTENDGEPTGRLLCVRCDPHWQPPGDEEEVVSQSIAAELRPFYEKWLNRNVLPFPKAPA